MGPVWKVNNKTEHHTYHVSWTAHSFCLFLILRQEEEEEDIMICMIMKRKTKRHDEKKQKCKRKYRLCDTFSILRRRNEITKVYNLIIIIIIIIVVLNEQCDLSSVCYATSAHFRKKYMPPHVKLVFGIQYTFDTNQTVSIWLFLVSLIISVSCCIVCGVSAGSK